MNINKSILKPKVQEFIKSHENEDVFGLILKKSPFESIDIKDIAQQIKGRQVAKDKFPKLYQNFQIIYPPKLNLEQSSSQQTAEYKSQFLASNESIIDLTGGLGIDTLAFAEKSQDVSYCEIHSETFEYAKHNFEVLEKPISIYRGDGLDYLAQQNKIFDWIYIDPARRDGHNKKVFRLEDCTPNILEHLSLFQSKSKRLLIKTSPLLDINLCIKQIQYITEIHVIALKNEVKELLLVIDFNSTENQVLTKAVNLDTNQDTFTAIHHSQSQNKDFTKPQTYLYEPNAAIMKSGLFAELSHQYKVNALAQNSHLFTSTTLIDFPGRCFKIQSINSPKKEVFKKYIPNLKANISCRNYPLKPEQIKSKYKLKDGGDIYLFFTTDFNNQKIVLICDKII